MLAVREVVLDPECTRHSLAGPHHSNSLTARGPYNVFRERFQNKSQATPLLAPVHCRNEVSSSRKSFQAGSSAKSKWLALASGT